MPGRHAKPIALHLAEGNPGRLTKEQIKQRQESEIKLGKNELDKIRPPAFVKNDAVAFACWKQLLKEFKTAADQGIELLTSSDTGAFAMYCKTYSEYERLQKMHQGLQQAFDDHDCTEKIDGLVSASESLIKVETAINKKMDMLIKLQDRLFLNPLAKVKNVTKPKQEEAKVSKFAKFSGGGAIGG